MAAKLIGPVMLDVQGLTLDAEDRELLAHPLVGGLILFSRNYADHDQLRQLVSQIRHCRPDLLLAVDYEGGRVQRFRGGFTPIPAMRQLGRMYEQSAGQARQLAHHCGWLIGAELGQFDIDLSFAPVLDLDGGVSEVIGDRAFHHEPEIAALLALSLMSGMRAAGMAATGKHYPGHGQVAPDSHAELPVDTRAAEALERDLQPFRRLIEAGLPSVMMAHIRFPAVDDLPASLSREWVTRRLRRQWGFAGAVFTDDLNMGGAAVMGDECARVRLALEAGCDMLPLCNNRPGVIRVLDQLQLQPQRDSSERLQGLRREPAQAGELLQNRHWQQARQALDSIKV